MLYSALTRPLLHSNAVFRYFGYRAQFYLSPELCGSSLFLFDGRQQQCFNVLGGTGTNAGVVQRNYRDKCSTFVRHPLATATSLSRWPRRLKNPSQPPLREFINDFFWTEQQCCKLCYWRLYYASPSRASTKWRLTSARKRYWMAMFFGTILEQVS
jgi:hypothetical protein